MKRRDPPDILLVEDEPVDIYLIQRAIADCRLQNHVWAVSTGSDALAFLLHEPPFVHVPTPALILLDLNIPRPDGHILLALVRRLATYQKTPVIIVSGGNRGVEEPYCQRLGATAYVEKTSDFATYFGGIQAALRDWL